MKQEEKQLLLTDLYGRLPYGVKGIITYNGDKDIFTVKGIHNDDLLLSECEACKIIDFKPYLRPLSSMSDDEKEELRQEQIKDEQLFADCIKNHPEMRGTVIPHFAADWCNKHHFNYRLPSHLFIEVTSENKPYTTENKDCSNADKDKVDDDDLWWEID